MTSHLYFIEPCRMTGEGRGGADVIFMVHRSWLLVNTWYKNIFGGVLHLFQHRAHPLAWLTPRLLSSIYQIVSEGLKLCRKVRSLWRKLPEALEPRNCRHFWSVERIEVHRFGPVWLSFVQYIDTSSCPSISENHFRSYIYTDPIR